ncbi:MAG TPA: hypothetical protein VF667_05695, partial [Pseudonocardia sp.]
MRRTTSLPCHIGTPAARKGDSTTSQPVPHHPHRITGRTSTTGAPHYMSTDTTYSSTASTTPQVAIN